MKQNFILSTLQIAIATCIVDQQIYGSSKYKDPNVNDWEVVDYRSYNDIRFENEAAAAKPSTCLPQRFQDLAEFNQHQRPRTETFWSIMIQNIHANQFPEFIEHCNKERQDQGFEFLSQAVEQSVEMKNQLHASIILSAAIQHGFLPHINPATRRRAVTFLEKKAKASTQQHERSDAEISADLSAMMQKFEELKKLQRK